LVEKLKETAVKMDHSEETSNFQRKLKKNERANEKLNERLVDALKNVNSLEVENGDLKHKLKNLASIKEENDYKIEMIQKEKSDLMNQLRELEVYKKFK